MFQQAQYKNSVNEAELAKVKARVIMLESAENQRKETDKKCEQMAHRLRETEKKLESNRKEINHYQVRSLSQTKQRNCYHCTIF